MAIAGTAFKLKKIIDKLKKSSKSIEDVFITSNDGLTLESTHTTDDYDLLVSALSSLLYEYSIRSSDELRCGDFMHTLISGSEKYFYICGLKPDAVLAVVIEKGTNWTDLIADINWAKTKIEELFEKNI